MVEWKITETPVDYPAAVAAMESRVAAIRAGTSPELIWLLEHPPLYTGGTSAKPSGLLDAKRFPVYETGRGGEYTYHGPGQRIAYVMLDLKARYAPQVPDLRDFVIKLERWTIATLATFGVEGFVREGRIGVWVNVQGGKEAKIAAQGIRVRAGVSYHGIAINLNPDLAHFSGIVPCGIDGYGVTSLAALSVKVSMPELDTALKETFSEVF